MLAGDKYRCLQEARLTLLEDHFMDIKDDFRDCKQMMGAMMKLLQGDSDENGIKTKLAMTSDRYMTLSKSVKALWGFIAGIVVALIGIAFKSMTEK